MGGNPMTQHTKLVETHEDRVHREEAARAQSDITRESLRRSEERLRVLIEVTGAGTWEIDADRSVPPTRRCARCTAGLP